MSTVQDRLTDSGWQQQVVNIKVASAKKKIEKDNLRFGLLLEAAMNSRAFDEDVLDFLTDQFPLPLPLVTPKEKLEQQGYYVLQWTTLDYSDANRGWPRAIVELKERALSAGVEALGKPTKVEQYLEVSSRHQKARQKWVHETLINPLEVNPDGTVVARWEGEDAWFVSHPLHNEKGQIIGYDYKLLYQDAKYVQTCADGGLVFEISYGRYNIQDLTADFRTEEFGTWCNPDGMLDFFQKNLFNKTDKGRASALVLGPSGGGKSSFIRSIINEFARDYVIFRVANSEFVEFEYPTFLQKFIFILEDVEDLVPPRGTGQKGSDAVLAKLEFSPLLASSKKGKLTHFGLFASCNTLKIDHAAVENQGRFDEIFYLDPSGWKTTPTKREIKIVDGNGVTSGTIPSVVQRAEQSVSEGLN